MAAPPSEQHRARWQDLRPGAMRGEAIRRALFEFDMQRSAITHLPGSWIGHAAGDALLSGTGLVPAHLRLRSRLALGKRVYLRLGGADYAASVYPRTASRSASIAAPSRPSSSMVTALLRAGSNQITIGVDSARTDG